MIKGSYCSYCGVKFTVETWPRKCNGCGNESFRNPIPVVVGIIPVWHKSAGAKFVQVGYVIQKRNIEPCKDGWSLCGGYCDFGETYQQAIARETYEEIGLSRPAEEFELLEIDNASNGNMLIFCSHQGVDEEEIKFKPNTEVSEIKIVSSPNDQKFCFSSHNEVFARYYEKYSNHKALTETQLIKKMFEED